MNHETILKLFSIFPPLWLLVVCMYILIKWHSLGHRTMSVHAAQDRVASTLLASVLIIGGAMYYCLFWFILKPKYHPPFFAWLLVLSIIAQILTALIPAQLNKRRASRAHAAAGLILSASMCIFAWLLVLGGKLNGVLPITTTWLFVLYATVSGLLLAISEHARQYVLYLEIAFVTLFCLFVGFITYA